MEEKEMIIVIPDKDSVRGCLLALAFAISGVYSPLSFIKDKNMPGYLKATGRKSVITNLVTFLGSVKLSFDGDFVITVENPQRDTRNCINAMIKQVPHYSMSCRHCFIPEKEGTLLVKFKENPETKDFLKNLKDFLSSLEIIDKDCSENVSSTFSLKEAIAV